MSTSWRARSCAVGILAVFSCGDGDGAGGLSAAELIENCSAEFDCSGGGDDYTLWLEETPSGCSTDGGDVLLPDGEIAGYDGQLRWRWQRGVLSLCEGATCLTCHDARCDESPPDCSERCSDTDRCEDNRDSCLQSCGSGPSVCRADCYSFAAICFDQCARAIEWCSDPPTCPARPPTSPM